TRKLEGQASAVTCVAFSPDGQTLASGAWRNLGLWNVATGAAVRAFLVLEDGEFVAALPDSNRLAFSYEDGSSAVWTTAGDRLIVFRHVSGSNAAYAFPPGPAPLIEFIGPEAEAGAA